ncbi:MAG: hypothetical protein SAL07_25350 [Oscillatoria sp. PMC 1051.18]|uniref:hypothetical protein n=1 Tax=Oscillatoria salina TaxID=331517 RepID=UPI0013BB2F52|nr:hypothetical protein [Oscillatoria salina]MBZ8179198.1 hypothetical protein [Oscillatoria salina IIICB1]MEC4896295.1 hypothetical protein [Oscillatoria sp. PMC 1050.18]MEC5033234.1 hypothetical protein [Oscillatoria sp. PMC 1051.18]NET90983.1 hypothetical protein [Kamptonema sp. SIO1D9]
MNAAEQAKGLEVASKIASIVTLFKSQFPDAKADLKPWKNDPDTRELVDPDSIDIGFHFPGWSRKIQSRSILVQIRFYEDPLDKSTKLIGLETAGFNHQGQAWRLSTVDNWQLVGNYQPTPDVGEKLKNFCRQVFELFNS